MIVCEVEILPQSLQYDLGPLLVVREGVKLSSPPEKELSKMSLCGLVKLDHLASLVSQLLLLDTLESAFIGLQLEEDHIYELSLLKDGLHCVDLVLPLEVISQFERQFHVAREVPLEAIGSVCYRSIFEVFEDSHWQLIWFELDSCL